MGFRPEEYDAWYETPFGAYADRLEKDLVFRYLGPVKGKKVLDIGCGTGNYSLELARRGAEVVGMDTSLEMLNLAKEKAERRGHDIKLILASMGHLPFKDGVFDDAVSITALEFCSGSPEKAVDEMRRVAMGRLVVGVINKWSLYGIEKKARAVFRPSIYRRARFYSLKEMKDLFGDVEWSSTLFALPWMPKWMLRLYERMEGHLSRMFKPFGAFMAIKKQNRQTE